MQEHDERGESNIGEIRSERGFEVSDAIEENADKHAMVTSS